MWERFMQQYAIGNNTVTADLLFSADLNGCEELIDRQNTYVATNRLSILQPVNRRQSAGRGQ